MDSTEFVIVDDLKQAIHRYRQEQYRLDMVTPADAPRLALMTGPSGTLRLQQRESLAREERGDGWTRGRAGMEYRDLLPGRHGGQIVASHIRLATEGEIADHVHYHEISFQIIYCKRGRIRVVYEDQGEPFWLETGDCVLQPPTIRHRVLACTAGAEVIEVGMPAEHETWFDHELTLPTGIFRPERSFSGQLFVHHRAAEATWTHSTWSGYDERDTGIGEATSGLANVTVIKRLVRDEPSPDFNPHKGVFVFPLDEAEWLIVRVPIHDA
jgi:quercetin dioxygenase-like cupin family protein